jgi:Cu+-exporting ATPase
MASFRSRQTAFVVSNLHCASCASSIERALGCLEPAPLAISHSILEHTVTVTYFVRLSEQAIIKTLEHEGYEVEAVIANPLSQNPKIITENSVASDSALERPNSLQFLMAHPNRDTDQKMQERHRANCKQCQTGGGDAAPRLAESVLPTDLKSTSFVTIDSPTTPKTYLATLTIDGMTCASCVSNVTRALESIAWVKAVNVNLLTKSATVSLSGKDHVDELISIIEDTGYDATLDRLDAPSPTSRSSSQAAFLDIWRATYSVSGMTCSSCVGNITRALNEFTWMQSVDVNLVTGSTVVVFTGKDHLEEITERIQDIGYEATLELVTETDAGEQIVAASRTVQIRIEGMYCEHCPSKIVTTLGLFDNIKINQVPTTKDPILSITYIPNAPRLTIRNILTAISNVDPAFRPHIFHPMTIEERSRRMHNREQRQILYRLLFCVVAAIPTFIIGIVFMSLVPKQDSTREYFMKPIKGASRAEWALFVLSTPVYFLSADIFHRRMIKELRSLWRKRSPAPIIQRFYRFGSMNMLISLGTTIAYVSSIAEMAVDAAQNKENKMLEHANPTYFDSVVFLTMFLLIGRYMEAHSKAKTGDAIAALARLRPSNALLQGTTANATENGLVLDGFD